jgi:hypothetical protein
MMRLEKGNLCVEQNAPKPLTPRRTSWEQRDASLRRADQLAEPVLSLVEGVKQGPPTKDSVPLLGQTAGVGAGETTMSVTDMKER